MTDTSTGKDREATGFQEQAPYDESIDLRTDFVMVYGLNDTTPHASPAGARPAIAST